MIRIPILPRRANARWLRFRVGAIGVSLRCEQREAIEDLTALYGDCFPTSSAPKDTIHIEVRAERRSRWIGRRYAISCDGDEVLTGCRSREILPYLEGVICRRVVKTRTEFLQLHAATLCHEGQAFLFAGQSGSGKSTLAAALLSRGWEYFSDELALIDPRTLRVHAFPKALCIKAGSFSAVQRMNLPLRARGHHVQALKGPVRYIRPPNLAGHGVAAPAPVRSVILPRYEAGTRPRLLGISHAEAVFELARCVLNPSAFSDRSTVLLCNLVREAECYRLHCGPFNETCDLVESVAHRRRAVSESDDSLHQRTDVPPLCR